MKEAGTLHFLYYSAYTQGNNNSGFTGLPGGTRFPNGTFDYISAFGDWWSSSEFDATNAFSVGVAFFEDRFTTGAWLPKSFGKSVRCLRD